jgi:membrane protein implicated in regulation of membrane protease activity
MLGQQVTIMASGADDGHLHTIFRDTRWSVASDDALSAGDVAEVVGVDSTTLLVKRVVT